MNAGSDGSGGPGGKGGSDGPGGRSVLDLTRVVDADLAPYSDGAYRDPPVEIATWCTVEEQGYWVSRLALGTQTGTHIDAPAHFAAGGATLDELGVEHLVGAYHLVDLPDAGDDAATRAARAYRDEPILLVRTPADGSTLAAGALDALCALPPRVWALAGSIAIRGADPLVFHRVLAGRGVYLVEDLCPRASRAVVAGGQLVALPLRLRGVSGAPCRVIAVLP